MFSKIRKFFGPKKLSEGNKIVVNCEKLETRVALLEHGSLEEYTVERCNDDNIVGSIFKGIIRNIEPGLNAMFVDIGLEKNAFLHFWDAIPEALDAGLDDPWGSASVWTLAGFICADNGLRDEGRTALERASKLDPGNHGLKIQLSMM